jgi:hypothetical protein
MLRLTRPGTPLARDFAERARSASARIGAEHVATTIAATGSKAGSARAALTFADHGLPRGAQTDDPTLDQQVVTSWPVVTAPARLGEGMRRVLERYGAAPGRQPAVGRQRSRIVVGPLRPPSIPPRGQDVSRIADEVRRRLDPQGAVRLALLERIPGLDGALGTNALPTRIPLGPVFDDALAPDLVAVGGDWLVPGLSALGANRVSLVDVNPTFVGAFLIGANDGLARELLWRGYPVDMRATFFHRFWQYVDPTRTDIGDVATQWRLGSSIEDNVKSEPGAMTAIVVRGDLVRRYPTAHWFLQRAARGEDGQLVPVAGTVAEVAFLVVVDRQTAVYGFDVATAAVRGEDGGDGYFVGVEEQVAGPRFGLDVAKPAQFTRKPASWDQLGWGHLVASEQELDDLTHATATGTRIDGLQLQGATWGRNSAHQARATWQRPFRMLIHADQFLG